jgi:malate permease and related proteins
LACLTAAFTDYIDDFGQESHLHYQRMNFTTTVTAISSVFLVGLIGYVSVKRRLLSHTGVTELARLLVDFILPAMLFYAMFTQYTHDKASMLIYTGCGQISLIATGIVAGIALSRLFRVKSHKGTIATLCSMQNNVYLPLPIAMALLPPELRAKALFIIGCFVMFFTPTLWSLGVVLISGRRDAGGGWAARARDALNPPFLAAILGLLTKILFIELGWEMPQLILSATKMIGDATTPLAMIVLGGLLAEAQWSRDFEPRAIIVVTVVKLILLPALTILAVRNFGKLDPVFTFILALEAAAPPATNISLVAKRFGGNTSLIALTLFITYMISMVTIPIWMSLL